MRNINSKTTFIYYKIISIQKELIIFDNLQFIKFPHVPEPQYGGSRLLLKRLLIDIEAYRGQTCLIALGDGAGHLSIKMAQSYPSMYVIATDVSPLSVTAIIENAKLNEVSLSVFKSDLLSDVRVPLCDQIIVAFNPPQISSRFCTKIPQNEWDFRTNFVDGDSLLVVSETLRQCQQKLPSGTSLYFSLISVLGKENILETFQEKGLIGTLVEQERVTVLRPGIIFKAFEEFFKLGGEFYPDQDLSTPSFKSLDELKEHANQMPLRDLFFEFWIFKTSL